MSSHHYTAVNGDAEHNDLRPESSSSRGSKSPGMRYARLIMPKVSLIHADLHFIEAGVVEAGKTSA